MYAITMDNNIQRIRIVGKAGHLDRVAVCSILSSSDEIKSHWGRIVYEIHRSRIFTNYDAAKKESFIRKLKGKDNV